MPSLDTHTAEDYAARTAPRFEPPPMQSGVISRPPLRRHSAIEFTVAAAGITTPLQSRRAW